MTAIRMPSKKLAAVLVSVYALCLFLVYSDTVASIVSIWSRSDTFAHGFLILPISLWLLWERRASLAGLAPEPEFRALLFLFGSSCAWLVASVANVLVVEQYALAAMLISGIWVIIGNRYALAVAFPLGFLLFAVPAGDGLEPPMMELTATYTVHLVRLSGVPVFREGLFFSLPTGNWSVVEACSGVRYLIASVTLGSLFAYLSYTSLLKRCLFIIAAIIVPIIGNLLRAYMIVMLGHLSDMKVATGVDHLIYGWFFFGILMLILFSIGSIWRDPPADDQADNMESDASAVTLSMPLKWATALVVVVASAGFLIERNLDQTPLSIGALSLPDDLGGWNRQNEPAWTWQPHSRGADQEVTLTYRDAGDAVGVYVGLYLSQDQESELINVHNQLVRAKDTNWRITSRSDTQILLAGQDFSVKQVTLRGASQKLLIWYWYRIGDRYTATPYLAKLYEVWNYISRGRQDSAKILLVTEIDGEPEQAAERLQTYIQASLPRLEQSIDTLVGEVE